MAAKLRLGIVISVLVGLGAVLASIPSDRTAPHLLKGNDCLPSAYFVLGETTEDEVAAVWGEPDAISEPAYTKLYAWIYRLPDRPMIVYAGFAFRQGILEEAWESPSNCTLGDVVTTLGPPETVEMRFRVSDNGPSLDFEGPAFRYTSQGLSFLGSNHCAAGTDDTVGSIIEACSSFHPNDEIVLRVLDPPREPSSETDKGWIWWQFSVFMKWTGFSEE